MLEAVQRIGDPPVLAGLTVSTVAGIGIAVNAFTAWLFARGRKHDINVRGAYLHMLSDAVVSAGVVLAGLAIWATGLGWIDPVVSLVIAALIFWQTLSVTSVFAMLTRRSDRFSAMSSQKLQYCGCFSLFSLRLRPSSFVLTPSASPKISTM